MVHNLWIVIHWVQRILNMWRIHVAMDFTFIYIHDALFGIHNGIGFLVLKILKMKLKVHFLTAIKSSKRSFRQSEILKATPRPYLKDNEKKKFRQKLETLTTLFDFIIFRNFSQKSRPRLHLQGWKLVCRGYFWFQTRWSDNRVENCLRILNSPHQFKMILPMVDLCGNTQ